MSDCIKRQVEFRKGHEQLRCIHPKADQFKQLVVLSECASCPVRVMRKDAGARCDSKKVIVHYDGTPRRDEGYPDCPYREGSPNGNLFCGITLLDVTPEICHRCDAETRTRTATIGDKVKNFARALRAWILAKCPTRTPEEIKHIYDSHCLGCDRRDPDTDSCKNCGCTVSRASTPLSNKLAMATEHCPLGRF